MMATIFRFRNSLGESGVLSLGGIGDSGSDCGRDVDIRYDYLTG